MGKRAGFFYESQGISQGRSGLAQICKSARLSLGISQREFSQRLGLESGVSISQTTVYRVESGLIDPPIAYAAMVGRMVGTELTTQVAVCPDCNGVHTGRCHNKPVATVACLAPGEHVVNTAMIELIDKWMAEDAQQPEHVTQPVAQRKRTRRAYYRPCLSPDPAQRIGQLETLLAEARKEAGE